MIFHDLSWSLMMVIYGDVMWLFCDSSFRIASEGVLHAMAYEFDSHLAKEDSDDDWGIAWKGDQGSRFADWIR